MKDSIEMIDFGVNTTSNSGAFGVSNNTEVIEKPQVTLEEKKDAEG